MANLKVAVVSILLLLSLASNATDKEIGKFWRAKKVTVDQVKVKRGQAFFKNQLIETTASSSAKAEITTIDDTRYILYKNSSIIFEDLNFSNGKCEGLKVTLNRGKLRTTSGKCGHGKTEVATTIASAYSLGTDYELIFIPKDVSVEGYEGIKSGFYQKVNSGQVRVGNDIGSLIINPGEVGFVASIDDMPMIIETPDFLINIDTPKEEAHQLDHDKVVNVLSVLFDVENFSLEHARAADLNKDGIVDESDMELAKEQLFSKGRAPQLFLRNTYTDWIAEGSKGNYGFIKTFFDNGNSNVSYSLEGKDAELFEIDSQTGEISVIGDIVYDEHYEPYGANADARLEFSVVADDGISSDSADIVIKIDDDRDYSTAALASLDSTSLLDDFNIQAQVIGPNHSNDVSTQGVVYDNCNESKCESFLIIDAFGKIEKSSYSRESFYDTYDSYSLDNSTITWGSWDSFWLEIDDGGRSVNVNVNGNRLVYIVEDEPNNTLALPITGILDYHVVDRSPVMLFMGARGTLDYADLAIDFATNNITAQFTITSDYGITTTSDEVIATLIPETGQFFGQTGNMSFQDYSSEGNILDYQYLYNVYDWLDPGVFPTGGVIISGTMMGNDGHHIGLTYGMAIDFGGSNDLALGSVLFANVDTKIDKTYAFAANIIDNNMGYVENVAWSQAEKAENLIDDGSDGKQTFGKTYDLKTGAIKDFYIDDFKYEPWNSNTESADLEAILDHGHYMTKSGTAINWGSWADVLENDTFDDSMDTFDGRVNFIFEERANESSVMTLPMTGVINYDVVQKSGVMIQDTTTSNWLNNGNLDEATLNIDFSNNSVKAQFSITDNTNTQIISDLIEGELNLYDGAISGSSGGFTSEDWLSPMPFEQGNGIFSGAMMGDNGSNVGLVYTVELGMGDKIGSGVVVFEAVP